MRRIHRWGHASIIWAVGALMTLAALAIAPTPIAAAEAPHVVRPLATVGVPGYFWAFASTETVTLKWLTPTGSGLVGYKLYRAWSWDPIPDPNGGTPIWEGSADATTYVDPGRAQGLWSYRLCAFDENGNWSEAIARANTGPAILGTVRDSSGTPLPDIPVTLYEAAGPWAWTAFRTTTTADDGTYDFRFLGELTNDPYVVGASDPLGRYMDGFHGGRFHYPELAEDFSILTPIATHASADVTMEPIAFIEGAVTSNFTRERLSQVEVIVSERRTYDGNSYWQELRRELTDATGHYRFYLSPGTYTVGFDGRRADHGRSGSAAQVMEVGGKITVDAELEPLYDHEPPATTCNLDGGWHRGPITVHLDTSDARPSPTSTWFTLNGSAPQTYTAPFEIVASGENTLEYAAVDSRNNRETTHTARVFIDSQPPSTQADVNQDPVAGDITLRLEAEDSDSGVAGTMVRYGGAVHPYRTPLTFAAPGTTTVEYWSIDRAGNREAAQAVAVSVPGAAAGTAPMSGDPLFARQWALENSGAEGGVPDADIDAPSAWAEAGALETVTVALVGDSVFANDADLSDRLWVNSDETPDNGIDDDSNGYVDDRYGISLASDPASYTTHVYDRWAAGPISTSVAGVVGARRGNGRGMAGVAPNALLMPIPVMDEAAAVYAGMPLGPSSPLALATAIEYAVGNGAQVVQVDAYAYGSCPELDAALLNATEHGVAVVVPAREEPTSYPQASEASCVVTVGASDNRDASAGAWAQGEGVDLVAPGQGVVAISSPRYAGLAVDKAPYRASYLAFNAEKTVPLDEANELIGAALVDAAPDTSRTVLIVDGSPYRLGDEPVGTRIDPYVTAARAAGYSRVETWVLEVQGGLSLEHMLGKTVVWLTGSAYNHYVNTNFGTGASDLLIRYLDGGGSLVFASGDLGQFSSYNWIDDDKDFLGTYLHARYLGLEPGASFSGLTDTLFAGTDASLSEYPGAMMWASPEVVLPRDTHAVPTLTWGSEAVCDNTEVAAAHVTGAIAFLRGALPTLSGIEAADRVIANVEPLPSLEGAVASGGRLNLLLALRGAPAVDPLQHETSVTLSAQPSDPRYGEQTTLVGRLLQGETGVVGATIRLTIERDGNSPIHCGSVVTDGDGAFRLTITTPSRTNYLATFRGQGRLKPTASPTCTVLPHAGVGRPSAPAVVPTGVPVRVAGYLKPRHRRGRACVMIDCFRLEGVRWVYYRSFAAVASDYSTYTKYATTLTLNRAGKWRVRARHSDGDHATSVCEGYRYLTAR